MAITRKHDDYTVAWVCVLLSEISASRALLDEEHEPLPTREDDDNSYLLGRMGNHNVVLVFPVSYGTNTASQAVTNTVRTFRNIRFGLMVGVGGSAPKSPQSDPRKDIRLGDIVVSFPIDGHGGVLQYEKDEWEDEVTFTIKSHLNKLPQVLAKAIKNLQLDHGFGKGQMWQYIDEVAKLDVPALEGSGFPGRDRDQLFNADYRHVAGKECSACDAARTESRGVRKSNRPEVHYGLIASGSAVTRSGIRRDELRDSWGVSCFETEAAGLMDNFPCVVIRGICDYSDSHRNKIWQRYSAVAAAAYAKDLLRVIPYSTVTIAAYAKDLLGIVQPKEVGTMPPAGGAITSYGPGAPSDCGSLVTATNLGGNPISRVTATWRSQRRVTATECTQPPRKMLRPRGGHMTFVTATGPSICYSD